MNEIIAYKDIIFESIKHIDESENEYWLARELQIVLEYAQWCRFNEVVNRAIISCKQSNFIIDEHFAKVGKTSKMPNGGVKKLLDYKLSGYACYLIVAANSYYSFY